MKPHLCTQCHYRNSTYLGRDELTASCDHPDLQPEGRDLTVTEFQAPDWCPLGLVQPIKQGRLADHLLRFCLEGGVTVEVLRDAEAVEASVKP